MSIDRDRRNQPSGSFGTADVPCGSRVRARISQGEELKCQDARHLPNGHVPSVGVGGGASFIGAALSASFMLLIGCTNPISAVPSEDGGATETGVSIDPYRPCTDAALCCEPEQLRCEGDGPDGRTVCTCEGLWDCSADLNKCEAERPLPGGGTWGCAWSEFKYSCEQKGSQDTPPPGGGDWHCVWQGSESLWRCNRDSPPNPSNQPRGAGQWDCTVDNESNRLVCERKEPKAPPKGAGEWDCTEGGVQQPECTKKDDNGGLPPGGGHWRCSRVDVGGQMAWICHGDAPKGDTPPGGGGWNCEQVGQSGDTVDYRCVKGDEPGDRPPGGGHWVCSKGTEFNGTRCVDVGKPPIPEPKVGQRCVPGTKMWCDGLQYCGWGQVECLPDGSWPTTVINGRRVVDCKERADGRRPNTTCACFHFYFNAACCERPDCMIDDGKEGQICPKSGGKLCDYCNPQKPECGGADAYCLVTQSMETFCGKACGADAQCPADYKCVRVKDRAQRQCIPSDFSCYR